MSAGKSFDQELAETLRTVRSLKASVPDEIEDYLHDSIVRALSQGRNMSRWWGYIYIAVKHRLINGREAQPYVAIEDSIFPAEERVSLDTKLDIKRALACLTPRKRDYIQEYFFEGWTLEEMEEKHGVSNQYISKVIKQALEDMRGVLDETKC